MSFPPPTYLPQKSGFPNAKHQCFECQLTYKPYGKPVPEYKTGEAPRFQHDETESDILSFHDVLASLLSLVTFIRTYQTLPIHGSPLIDWSRRGEDSLTFKTSIAQANPESDPFNIEDELRFLMGDLIQCHCVHRSVLQRYIKVAFMAPAWRGKVAKAADRAAPAKVSNIATVTNGFAFLTVPPLQQFLHHDIVDRLRHVVRPDYEDVFIKRVTELWDMAIQSLYNGSLRTHVSPVAFSLGATLANDSPVEFMQQKRKHIIDNKGHWLCTHWLALETKLKASFDGPSLTRLGRDTPRSAKMKMCPEKRIPDIARLKAHLKQDHGYSKDDLRCSRDFDEKKWDELFQICTLRLEMTLSVENAELSSLPTKAHSKCGIDSSSVANNDSPHGSLDTIADAQLHKVVQCCRLDSRASNELLSQVGSQFPSSQDSQQYQMDDRADIGQPTAGQETDQYGTDQKSTIDSDVPSYGDAIAQIPQYDTDMLGLGLDFDTDAMEMGTSLPPFEQRISLSPPQQPLRLWAVPSPWEIDSAHGIEVLEDFDFGIAHDYMDCTDQASSDANVDAHRETWR